MPTCESVSLPPVELSSLNCCPINARSLCNKLVELHHLLVSNSLDILLVTESWLTPEYSSSLLSDPKCSSVLSNDRISVVGGVCAFIKYRIDFVSVDVPSAFRDLELLVFDVIALFCHLCTWLS